MIFTTHPTPEPRAVDQWLRRDLCRRYGKVLQEPLPDELLTLLEAASSP